MLIKFKKTFLKDLKSIPRPRREVIERLVFDELPQKRDLREVANLKKIKGRGNYYRIRHGEYRIGIEAREDAVVCCRVLHRKDISRYFP